jgi:hypothetical protein
MEFLALKSIIFGSIKKNCPGRAARQRPAGVTVLLENKPARREKPAE